MRPFNSFSALLLLLSISEAYVLSSSAGIESPLIQHTYDPTRNPNAPHTFHNEDVSKARNFTHELLSLHKSLVSIPSISDNETDVGVWLADYLSALDYTVYKQPVAHEDGDPSQSERYNIYAHPNPPSTHHANSKSKSKPKPKPKPKQSIVLTSHIDTVPPFIPYTVIHGSTFDSSPFTIKGRATADAKASVAAMIIALEQMRHSIKQAKAPRIAPEEIGLLFVVSEERGGAGMRAANTLPRRIRQAWKSVVFGEPTTGKLVSGHKGLTVLKIHFKGVAAHSGYPWLGASANDMMITALSAIKDAQRTLPKSDKFGETTVNMGLVRGGVANNVVPQDAYAEMAIRIAEGEPDMVRGVLVGAVEDALGPQTRLAGSEAGESGARVVEEGGKTPKGSWFAEDPMGGYSPVNMSTDIDSLGGPKGAITVNYGTDVPNMDGDWFKRYLFGPGRILVAHGPNEEITWNELWGGVVGYGKILGELVQRDLSGRRVDGEETLTEDL